MQQKPMHYMSISPFRDAYSAYLRRDYVSSPNQLSVTQLLMPVRVLQLLRRYQEQLSSEPVTDDEISKSQKAFNGNAIHDYFNRQLQDFNRANPQAKYILERSFMDKINGVFVKGKLDAYRNGCIYDFKTCSTFKYVKGQWSDFEIQLNLYAHLLREHGFKVSLLQLICIFTDWDYRRADQADYPSYDVETVTLPLWTPKRQLDTLTSLVSLHTDSASLADDDLPECTEEECWSKPTTYAVKIPGGDRALRVLDSEADAQKYIANSKNKEKASMVVECRKGGRTRCENYCKCNVYCSQYKQYQEGFVK